MQSETIFSVNVWREKYLGNIEIIEKHIRHIQEFDAGRKRSNEGGYQSNDITFGFTELINFIKNCFADQNTNVSLGNFWLNINKGTDENLPHIHTSNAWSVVYYHKICCNKSPIYFDPIVPHLPVFGSTYFLYPNNQELLFFDGIIPHGVQACGHTDHERISIAFNFIKLPEDR